MKLRVVVQGFARADEAFYVVLNDFIKCTSLGVLPFRGARGFESGVARYGIEGLRRREHDSPRIRRAIFSRNFGTLLSSESRYST